MKHGITIACTVALTVLAASAFAQGTEEFRWTGVVTAGGSVEVRGINGGIDAGPASGAEVEVVTVKRSKRSGHLSRVKIEVVEHDGGVTICAVYPGGECAADGSELGDTEDARVEVSFDVRVPRGVDLDASTVNGKIVATSLTGSVEAATVNGAIDVTAAGTVEARTVNGDIDASTGATSWNGTLSFKTVNGAITVTMPAGANALVDAKTVNGGLETDFPLTIHAGRGRGPRSIEGTIGSGGGELELKTVNGAIRLRRS